jgi:uncharacterized protein YerC
MVHISKRALKPHIQGQILKQLTLHITRLRGAERTEHFLSEFLTDAERVQLAKRLAIFILLVRGYSFGQIEKLLKVSQVTVIKIWKAYKNGKFKTLEAESIFNGQSFRERTVFEALIHLLTEGLPPRAGKGRWKFLKGV